MCGSGFRAFRAGRGTRLFGFGRLAITRTCFPLGFIEIGLFGRRFGRFAFVVGVLRWTVFFGELVARCLFVPRRAVFFGWSFTELALAPTVGFGIDDFLSGWCLRFFRRLSVRFGLRRRGAGLRSGTDIEGFEIVFLPAPCVRLLFGQKRDAVGDRDLVVVRMDFRKGEEPLPVPAIFDESRL